MLKMVLIALIAILVTACPARVKPPQDAGGVGQEQAALAVDPGQVKLWQEAAGNGARPGIEALLVEHEVVRKRKLIVVAEQPMTSERVAFPEAVSSGMRVLAVPKVPEAYAGAARVRTMEQEFIDLDLGDGRILSLQAKVDGNPLRVRVGETAQLLLRRGDPYQRNDILAVKLEQDDLIHALVSDPEPVSLSIPSHGLAAEQTGVPERNTMSVKVTVGGETHTLRPGEQAGFSAAGLTVKVLASVAVQGPAAFALEGDPYRVELLGWRTRMQ